MPYVLDIKNIKSESVELQESNQMCSYLNIQSKTVSVEPCENKKMYICNSPETLKPSDSKKNKTTANTCRPCPGKTVTKL